MSRIEQALALIAERGPSTADELLPAMPGSTRRQVIAALQNARFDGRLVAARGRGLGGGIGGSELARYSLGRATPIPRKDRKRAPPKPSPVKAVKPPKEPKPKPVKPRPPLYTIRPVASVWEMGSRCALEAA